LWHPRACYDDLRWQPLDGDHPIVAGTDAISTPGHMSLRIRMAESGTFIWDPVGTPPRAYR
jgi:hypothetical protein